MTDSAAFSWDDWKRIRDDEDFGLGQVDCPFCHAEPGVPCVTTGGRLAPTHSARVAEGARVIIRFADQGIDQGFEPEFLARTRGWLGQAS